MIVNFKEYLEALSEMFVGEQAAVAENYVRDMMSAGKKQQKAKEKLQNEIILINAKIRQLRAEIAVVEDKRVASAQIKRLKAAKSDLVQKIKQREQTSRFAVLAGETKIALCTLNIMRRYLSREMMENQFCGMPRLPNGDIRFERTVFENSYLYQDAIHIRDYVAAYLTKYPERVVSEKYFSRLFDKESGWRGICHQADKFFELQSQAVVKKSRAEIIGESRSDLQLIKEYPGINAVLVALKSPEALDYEGTAMHHCVGSSYYDRLLTQPQSGIYSIRRLMPDGELKPKVTIELRDGKIQQIRGVCNNFVPYRYRLPSRDAVLALLGKDTQEQLAADVTVSDTVLHSIGLYRRPNGGYIDIYNLADDEDFVLPQLILTADDLSACEWDKIKIDEAELIGPISAKEIKKLSAFVLLNQLNVENVSEDCVLDLSSLGELTSLTLKAAKPVSVRLQGCGSKLRDLSLDKIIPVWMESFSCPQLERISLRNLPDGDFTLASFPKLKHLAVSVFAAGKSGENKLAKVRLSEGKTDTIGTADAQDSGGICVFDNQLTLNFSKLPFLPELSFSNMDLSKDFYPPENVKCFYSNCILNEALVKRFMDQSLEDETQNVVRLQEPGGFSNKVAGRHFDFSEFDICLDLDHGNFCFFEAETIKLPSSVERASITVPYRKDIKIFGLHEVKHLSLSGELDESNILDMIDSQKLISLSYHNYLSPRGVDFSRFSRLKRLVTANVKEDALPESLEELTFRCDSLFFTQTTEKAFQKNFKTLDFSRLKKLRCLEMTCLPFGVNRILFPESLQQLRVKYDVGVLEELDLSRCRQLREVELQFLGKNIRRVVLPAGVEKLDAARSSVGIGMACIGQENVRPVVFEIPSDARPEIISYLREQWGEGHLRLKAPEKQTRFLPILRSNTQNSR